MTFLSENESGQELEFDWGKIGKEVAEKVLELECCPYETEVSLLLTTGEEIREMNQSHRGIDQVTDVLSFPFVEYEHPSDFDRIEEEQAECFHPDTGELMLGDIVICISKLCEQAQEYGHCERREFAFLVAHSMLHLLGYDHMEEAAEKVMVEKQKCILDELCISR